MDSNIVFVFFELSARWASLDQELTVFSVEFSSSHIFVAQELDSWSIVFIRLTALGAYQIFGP